MPGHTASLTAAARALRDEAATLAATLRDWRPAAALGLLALLLALAAQLPLAYRVEVGQEDGPGGDLPILAGFNTAEHDGHGTYRWTDGDSRVRLPGVGARAVQLELRTFPVNEEVARSGPQSFELWSGGRLVGTAAVRPTGGAYRFLVPPPPDGDLLLSIRSATVVPTGDVRTLGVVVDSLRASAGPGPALPAWRPLLGWLAALALAWLVARRSGYAPDPALALLLAPIALAGTAAALDPPRAAMGAGPAAAALGLALALVLALRARPLALVAAGLPLWGAGALLASAWPQAGGAGLLGLALALAGAARSPRSPLAGALADVPEAAWRALCLLAAATFALRYGAKVYPDSMPGDIGFHVNRFADVLRGTIFLLSKHRSVDFPYPPALYMLLAPLALALPDRATLLRASAALMDALSPLLIYLICARSGLVRSWQMRVAASAGYALCGGSFMTTWWNFSTHIFAQFAHLALVAALVAGWPALTGGAPGGRRAGLAAGGLLTIQWLVYLGHFGFWVNIALLGGMGLAWLGLLALRGRAGWAGWWRLALIFAAGQALAVALFYSSFAGLFINQARLTAEGGLTELAGRAPIPAADLWEGLVEGLYAHVGLLPIPLALCGLLLRRGRPPARALIALTLVVALGFAALPFLTASTLSTRWLMFSLWAIAVGAAAAAELLWRSGRAGRLLAASVGLYALWLSAAMWLSALAWRVRPPEPF